MNENDVVIKQCDEVRVYVSETGYVCIWQSVPDGDNQIVSIPPNYAADLARAIARAGVDLRNAAGV